MNTIQSQKDKKLSYVAVNWNEVEESIDKQIWEKLTEQFWLDTRIPISNDLDDWRATTSIEKNLIERVFGGLTLLDTLQSQDGVDCLKSAARSQHEIAVYNNIAFMEAVHAKSYSAIFSTLNTPKEISEIFSWVKNTEVLQYKALKINEVYQNGSPLQKKVASVFLESFLFYSGFYTPLYFSGINKMSSVAEVIRLIIRDESVHGTYIGFKFQMGYDELPPDEKDEIKSWAYSFLYELYNNEVKFTELLYDDIGWTEDVKTFVRYNANKALSNLGFDPLFPDTAKDVNPIVMNGISTSTSSHDFFSQVGNGYLIGEVEAMKDSDYQY